MGTVRRMQAPEGVLAAVQSAVAAMTWLTPSDAGLVALAVEYARKIDAAEDEKVVGWMGPHLANTLRALGGSPGDRQALGIEETVRGKLAELRGRRSPPRRSSAARFHGCSPRRPGR